MQDGIERRRFVKYALAGAMTLAVGVQAPRVASLLGGTADAAASGVRSLIIGEALAEMADLTQVYVRTFSAPGVPAYPGPVISVLQGDEVRLSITNALREPHAFAVAGTGVGTGPIAPGATAEIAFPAPAPGTYVYLDPTDAPVNRLLGLAGVLVVLPGDAATPYASPTPAVRRLFGDLGSTAHFPGEPWKPARTRVWHLHTIDPRWHDMALQGRPIDPARMAREHLPRYFLLNGRSGYFASHDHDTAPYGRIGQPHLIRIANTGSTANALHIHGNHVYVLAEDAGVRDDVPCIDTWRVPPLGTVDWLLPYVCPPDIPGAPAHLRTALREELAYRDPYGLPQSPIEYPMHCHAEPSQTAAGGNYPGGLVTHWAIAGDLDGVDLPGADPALYDHDPTT